MKKISILLVDDEKTLALIIKDTLLSKGYEVHVAYDGAEGLKLFHDLHPNILVADVMMPRLDGFEMVRQIRRHDSSTPVLFLTAKSSADDVVEGFELGANDYLKKPFAIQELEIRIRALLGKAYMTSQCVHDMQDYKIGEYSFTPNSQTLVHVPTGDTIVMSHRESAILRYLCRANGEVVPMRSVLLEIWGDDDFFNARSFQVFITRLRRYLSKDPHVRIVNVRGTGYRLLTTP